ncbi:MAG: hypothetical protein II201_00815 [Clostridia bacterium]|nr:hypothetical protein [Clostridia bacterium]
MNKRKISANAKFCFRSDTLENWESLNPVLGKGEFAVVLSEEGSNRVKIGDGVKQFTELAFWNEPETPIFNLTPESFEAGYIDPSKGTIIAHNNYMSTDYLPVTALSEIYLNYIYCTGFSLAHFYDADKKHITSIKTTQNAVPVYDCIITVPPKAKFMRVVTSKLVWERNLLTVRYNKYIPESQTMNALVKGWYNRTDGEIAELFKKASTPMVTFIDDDTINLEHINAYYELCEYAGIKGCLSVLTANLDGNENLVNRLLELERKGYQAIIHCNTQGAEFGEFTNKNAEERSLETIASCEENLVTGLQKMHKFGFANYKYWCTPFGYMDKTLRNLAKKWGLKCLISSGNLDYNKPTSEYAERYKVRRMTLNNPALDTADSNGKTSLQRIKDAITAAAEDGGWVLVTTHTYESGWAGDAGKARFKELADHAKTEGVAIKTVGEAFSIREPIYRFYETF